MMQARWIVAFALAVCAAPPALCAQGCPIPDAMRTRMAGTRDADTFADLGIALANAKQYACAASAFAESLKTKPDSANVLFMFGASLDFSGNPQEAVAALQASETLDGRNLKLHLVLAAVFDQLHRDSDAVAEWKAAVETDPLSTEALDGLSQDLVLDQQDQAAIDLLDDPKVTGLRTALQSLNLGTAYAGLAQLDAASEALRDGLNTTPDSLPIAAELADVLAQAHHADEADAVLQLALARHPADTETALHRLRLLLAADPQKATAVGRELLRTAPGNWEVLYLNGVLAAQNGDMEQARAHLQAALALNDASPLAHSLLGVVLARLSDFSGAQLQLQRAIALGDSSQEVRDNLARVEQALPHGGP
ncbi:MAG TPA: tetratricopeptide repeat protein [Acidobacteriaceae bacterium]|jgi:Flp pilus assembly protein TadD|nr:tetratricopeptide repeat protein [Acidobacteriaceae bacterium]